jgi:GT2 family glycosyltransferase
VLVTCHNRKAKTIACLRALRDQGKERKIHDAGFAGGDSGSSVSRLQICSADVSAASHRTPSNSPAMNEVASRGFSALSSNRYAMNLFLVDDGSTDGTTVAVHETWPEATVIKGSGNLYWCGGMRAAWAVAAKTDPDFFLLLNDDTLLFPNAICDLLALAPTSDSRLIAVGAICDPVSGEWTYGGGDCKRPFDPHYGGPRDCRSLNANCALVPRAVFREIGMFDKVYTHSMGDHDYGYAATRAGIPIRETARFVGECSKNPTNGTWLDTSLTIATRLSKLFSVKGLPPREWWHYCRKNIKGIWLAIFISPYFKTLIGR